MPLTHTRTIPPVAGVEAGIVHTFVQRIFDRTGPDRLAAEPGHEQHIKVMLPPPETLGEPAYLTTSQGGELRTPACLSTAERASDPRACRHRECTRRGARLRRSGLSRTGSRRGKAGTAGGLARVTTALKALAMFEMIPIASCALMSPIRCRPTTLRSSTTGRRRSAARRSRTDRRRGAYERLEATAVGLVDRDKSQRLFLLL